MPPRPPPPAPLTFCIDIETSTSPDAMLTAAQAETFTTPADYTAWMVEHAGDHALHPVRGRVVCWAVASSDGRERAEVDRQPGGGERVLLEQLAELAQRWKPECWVAHNGHGFDFPFLRARALAHGLDSLAKALWQSKPWDGRLIDTLDPSWCPRPARSMKGWRLDDLAELLGIERAETTPGADVPAAWYRQDFDSIAAHCLDDARTLRAVWRRLAAGRGV